MATVTEQERKQIEIEATTKASKEHFEAWVEMCKNNPQIGHLGSLASSPLTYNYSPREKKDTIYISIVSPASNPCNLNMTIHAGMNFSSLEHAEHFALGILGQVEEMRKNKPQVQ